MRYWLMKSEPDEFGIDDLAAAPGGTTAWFGVRNYQARNFMLEQMQIGDKVFFYHSSCPEPGIAGIAEVSSAAYPDASQFDRKSPTSTPRRSASRPAGSTSMCASSARPRWSVSPSCAATASSPRCALSLAATGF